MYETNGNGRTYNRQVLSEILEALAEFRPRATDVGDAFLACRDVPRQGTEDLLSELTALRTFDGLKYIFSVAESQSTLTLFNNQILDVRHQAILNELEHRGVVTETWPPPITAPVAKAKSNGHKVGVAV